MFQFFRQRLWIPAAQACQLRPEPHAMVFVPDVRQLMQQEIILQVTRQKDHVDIQGDVVVRRAASPLALLTAKCRLLVGQFVFF